MMSTLRLFLLGAPRLENAAEPVEIGRRKALALLALLAVTGKSHSREALAAMFWPEAARSDSRAALRRVLSDLNKQLGERWARGGGSDLQIEPALWVDVNAFRSLLAGLQAHGHPAGEVCEQCIEPLSQAASLYRGDFLSGFSLPDSPAFDDWQFFENESLRGELSDCLERLVNYHLAQETPGALQPALALARRWAALDPLQEAPQRALIQLYSRLGQAPAALRQQQEYARRLKTELGLQPSAELAALARAAQRQTLQSAAGRGEPVRPAPKASPPAPELITHPDDEIRLMTALFVGFNPPRQQAWEMHPEKITRPAQQLLPLAHSIAARYGARLDRFVGKGMYILFGVEQAHEDDAERAMQAALEILNESARIGLAPATGASSGQVYITQAAPAGELLVGPALNLAARLQDLAAAGQILVSPATYSLAKRAFAFQSIPILRQQAREAENEPESLPETAYQLIGVREAPEIVHGGESWRARLIGRDEELRLLQNHLADLLDGRGSIVALAGEAGIGKSRLVDELRQQAISAWDEGRLLLWLECRSLEWRTPASYWPFIDLLHNLFHYFSAAGEPTALTLAALLDEMVERGDLPSGRAAEIGALLGSLLSIRFGEGREERLPGASPELVQRLTFQAIYDFIVALARQQPLVLVFEDLHWADDVSLDLLALLMEAVPQHPLLLLCLYRPRLTHKGRRLAGIARQRVPGHYTEISLGELTPEESLSLAGALLNTQALPPDLDRLILSKSWGNPFFLEEAIRALVSQGIVTQQDGQWAIAVTPEEIAIPESVQSVILSRVDRLEAEQRSLLRSAAVIGSSFGAAVLAEIAPAEIDLDAALWALEEAALVYRQRVFPEVEYSFKHALTQEAVYLTIGVHQRQELHRRTAEALERRRQAGRSWAETGFDEDIERLAYHYQRSAVDEKAIEYLLKAGDKAGGSYRNREAIHFYRQALERWEKLPGPAAAQPEDENQRLRWKLAALAGLGQIYHSMGEEAQAEDWLLQAIAVGQRLELETPALLRLYYWLAEVLHWQRRYSEQIHLGQAGQALLAEDQNETLEAALTNQIVATGYLGRGDEEAFDALTLQTAAFIRKLPYSEELRPAYMHIILSLYNSRQPQQARQWLALLQELAEERGDLRAQAEVIDYQLGYSFQSGDLDAAVQCAERVLELHPRTGDPFRLWRSQRDLSWAALLSGDLPGASAQAFLALEEAERQRVSAYVSESCLLLGLAALCEGRHDEAWNAFERAAQPGPYAALSWTEWVASCALGQTRLAQGRGEAAIELFCTALQHYSPYHLPLGWWFNRWPVLSGVLSGLESACRLSGNSSLYAELCTQFEALKHRRSPRPAPAQWALADAPGPDDSPLRFRETFEQAIDPQWLWIDPSGGCRMQTGDGLEIGAANGRDLWHLNLSAPRLLRPAQGDFAIQALLAPPGSETGVAQSGGLLLWLNEDNFLRLALGLRGPLDLAFEGCLQGQNLQAGRGLLPEPANPGQALLLRLERRGEQVQALCAWQPRESAAPLRWYSAGRATFPAAGGLLAGLHASGWIDRLARPAAYPHGALVRFGWFEIYD